MSAAEGSGAPLERNPMIQDPPANTGCSEVLAEVWLFLDHECDQERRRLLQQHLDECGPCLAEYGIDEKLKALLARKRGGEAAPAGSRTGCGPRSAPRCSSRPR
ncbi:mycothiol system anti-sigma-R factor [Pseudonocardia sp. ICBG601]|uniref:mycothiol system anti-sigma-R factor n=1 Tax=Pseudonocardia sp. ICBG601 TaxID=2846759 RepID=UPI0035ABDACF